MYEHIFLLSDTFNKHWDVQPDFYVIKVVLVSNDVKVNMS